jgi:ArsR family transcriptional regulator
MPKTLIPVSVPAQAVSCCGITLGAALDPYDAGRLARGFAALADPVRVQILSLIAATGEVCSCDLVAATGKSQPTVSHHTKVLSEAGLIVGDKRGKWTWWRTVPAQIDALRDALAAANA